MTMRCLLLHQLAQCHLTYQQSTSSSIRKLKLFGEEIESHLPSTLREGARRARQLVTGRSQSTFFEDLGFSYLGPIDGYDMGQLLYVLRAAKFRSTGPTLIHVCTKKGMGMHQLKTPPISIMSFKI